jgi:hypothetical protein
MSVADVAVPGVVRAILGASLLSLATVSAVPAQNNSQCGAPAHAPAAMHAVDLPTSMPIRAAYVNVPIRVDGALDEPIWRIAPASNRFIQREPSEGALATHPTEVRMLVTDSAVIIGARMTDDKSALFGSFGPPADGATGGYLSDYFEVQIDPHHDHVTAFALAVSPGGGKKSWIMARDGTRDASWDIHWDAATRVDDNGWSVEIKIPINEFHVRPGTESWGVQYVRSSWRRQETDIYTSAVQRAPMAASGSDANGGQRP